MRVSMDYIVIDGAEWAVTLDGDDGGWRVTTGADCHCGSSDWDVEHRNGSDDAWIVCENGHEFPVQYRKDGAA